MDTSNRVPLALLCLRVGVFIVMFIWMVDKFLRPEHAATVFEGFYFLSGVGSGVIYLIGAVELVVIAGFLAGFQKRWTYGAVFILHGISTISTFKQYLAPFEGPNLLFFAAWPMLAACFALYYLRDLDTMWTVGGKRTGG